MAAEIISAAVVGEAVNRVVSRLISGGGGKEERDSTERLEMARIRMEAALELSGRWQITDVPLLRWRRKLKRAAEECDGALLLRRKQRQRAEDDEQAKSRLSFPRRAARAAKSFVSAFIGAGDGGDGVDDDESSPPPSSILRDVQRFERYADGASEFLKLVELGGTRPRPRSAFFDPLISRLLAGEAVRYQALRGGKFYFLGIRPLSFEERGVEAMVGFVVQNFMAPARSFNLRFMMRLSESTDVLGLVINCMQSATPHFRSAAEDLARELAQLPTQDFYWVDIPYSQKRFWIDVHTTLTCWFRPDPLCCNGDDHGHHHHRRLSAFPPVTGDDKSSPSLPPPPLCSTYPEQVIVVHLQCYILAGGGGDHEPPLKLLILFIPHDHQSSSSSYAFEVIDEEEQDAAHAAGAGGLHDVDVKLLPKAVDHLRKNEASRMYQVCVRSSHGTAHLCVEKTATLTTATRRRSTRRGSRRGSTAEDRRDEAAEQRRKKGAEDYSIVGWQETARELLKLWVVRASDRLHGSIRSWISEMDFSNWVDVHPMHAF